MRGPAYRATRGSVLLLALLGGIAGCGARTPITCREGGFAVTMPGTPESTDVDLSTERVEARGEAYRSIEGGTVWMAAYIRYSPDYPVEGMRTLREAMSSSLLRSGSTLTSRRYLFVNGAPAVDYTTVKTEESYRQVGTCRLMLSGRTLYMLAALRAGRPPQGFERFASTFRLLPSGGAPN